MNGDEELDDEDDEIKADDPDYDLSEAHGYLWDPQRQNWPVPPWLLAGISIVVVVALVLPALLYVLSSR